MLADTASAIIVGFNVRPDNVAQSYAARNNVDIRLYRVIYDALNEIESAMKGLACAEVQGKSSPATRKCARFSKPPKSARFAAPSYWTARFCVTAKPALAGQRGGLRRRNLVPAPL